MFNLEALKRNEENPDEEVVDEEVSSPELYFEPVVKLNQIETKSLEDDEEEIYQVRCKLYRFDNSDSPPQYKERGVGVLKFLRHKTSRKIRILMRREQTLKICANHYMNTSMRLIENKSSDRSWIWSAVADFADEVPKDETLACRFSTVEDAKSFKLKFEECVASLEILVSKSKENNAKPNDVKNSPKDVALNPENKKSETTKSSSEAPIKNDPKSSQTKACADKGNSETKKSTDSAQTSDKKCCASSTPAPTTKVCCGSKCCSSKSVDEPTLVKTCADKECTETKKSTDSVQTSDKKCCASSKPAPTTKVCCGGKCCSSKSEEKSTPVKACADKECSESSHAPTKKWSWFGKSEDKASSCACAKKECCDSAKTVESKKETDEAMKNLETAVKKVNVNSDEVK